jgi:hypothetical protein
MVRKVGDELWLENIEGLCNTIYLWNDVHCVAYMNISNRSTAKNKSDLELITVVPSVS